MGGVLQQVRVSQSVEVSQWVGVSQDEVGCHGVGRGWVRKERPGLGIKQGEGCLFPP